MNKLQALESAYEARARMRHDEAAQNYDHAADLCEDARESQHLRSMANSCRTTSQRKRDGLIPVDWQTG